MQLILSIGAVAAGGAVGAVGRYAIALGVRGLTPWPAYTGTFLANMIGCFGIGVVFALLDGGDRPDWVRALLVTGLLGAFTTFSTFSLEAMHLIDDRRFGELAAYIGVSVVLGLLAVKGGMAVGG